MCHPDVRYSEDYVKTLFTVHPFPESGIVYLRRPRGSPLVFRCAYFTDCGSRSGPDHFEAPLTPAGMTMSRTTGNVGRSRGLVSSASGIATHYYSAQIDLTSVPFTL
jgi:hypothetical protein